MLKMLEPFLLHFIDNYPDIILLVDNDGKIIHANEYAVKAFGYSKSKFQGLSIEKLVPERFRAAHVAHRNVFKQSPKTRPMDIGVELPALRRDQTEFPSEISLYPMKIEDAHFTLCIVRDLSEKKSSLQKLDDISERFLNVFDSSEDAIFITRGYYFVDCNKKTLELFGCRREDIIGKSLDFFSPETQPDGRNSKKAAQEKIDAAMDGHPQRFEWTHQKLDGTTFYTEVSLFKFEQQSGPYIMAFVKDITKQKQAEEKLRRSELKYRKLFEEDLTGDFISDAHGRIQLYNKTFKKIFKISEVEYTEGLEISRFFKNPSEWKDLFNRLKTNHVLKQYETEMVTCQLDTIHVVQNLVGEFNEQGEMTNIRGYLMDVTESKILEQKLMMAQKMEAIGKLASGVAHDFNNLLTVINGYSEILLLKEGKDSPLGKDIEQILKAGKRAAGLTTQLLAFSRKQIIQPRTLNLNKVIRGIEKMLRRLIKEDSTIVVKLERKLKSIKADYNQLEQILMNLIVNARDAMPKGGQITIETFHYNFRHPVFYRDHNMMPQGNYVGLAVSDTGFGMDAETKKKIFEPFFSTKKQGGGTGLGLSTVYGIVKQNNGYIYVYSEPGIGTTFRIYFPALEKTEVDFQLEKKTSALLQGNETILIVEDDRDVIEITKTFIGNSGYKVLTATNAVDAINVCKNYKDKIDLIISDVIMPGMNSNQFIDQLVKITPKSKLLFVSGYTDEAIASHGVLSTDVAFLPKPFSLEGINQKIREVLNSDTYTVDGFKSKI